jgi:hypothetical protein
MTSATREVDTSSRVPVRLGERLCMWSAFAIAAVMTAGFLIGGIIPPPAPTASAQDIVHFYFDDPASMRIGVVLMTIGATFILPFGCVMASQVRRIEGPRTTMTNIMIAASAFVVTATLIYLFILLTLTYRPERDPQLMLLLSDFAWLPFIGMWQPAALQAIAVGTAVLSDRDTERRGHWPRWVGWVSIWYAFTSLVGLFVPFVVSGALSWDGLVPFYLGAFALFGWWVLMAVMMLRATRRERPADREEAASRCNN